MLTGVEQRKGPLGSLACQEGQRDTPRQLTKEEAAANPLQTAIKKSDAHKYLPESRTDPSDWKTGKTVRKLPGPRPQATLPA